MTDDLAAMTLPCRASAMKPLAGLTMLVVEDSRFASETLRLMCRHSGARLRRADCLRSAYRHLSVYRPGAVIVDLGLPDGSGLDLIRDLARAVPRVPVLLATSGDISLEDAAIAAGADAFIAKPLASLAAFQQALLAHMPEAALATGLRMLPSEQINPDPLALRDDLAHAARFLDEQDGPQAVDYVARFLMGLARSAGDEGLAEAARALVEARQANPGMADDLTRIAGLVQERLATGAQI